MGGSSPEFRSPDDISSENKRDRSEHKRISAGTDLWVAQTCWPVMLPLPFRSPDDVSKMMRQTRWLWEGRDHSYRSERIQTPWG